ncbi:MAG: hypothetical protein Q7S31_01020 [bacterium]|nr:hypothetical protein [bacterium]
MSDLFAVAKYKRWLQIAHRKMQDGDMGVVREGEWVFDSALARLSELGLTESETDKLVVELYTTDPDERNRLLQLYAAGKEIPWSEAIRDIYGQSAYDRLKEVSRREYARRILEGDVC